MLVLFYTSCVTQRQKNINARLSLANFAEIANSIGTDLQI